MVDNGDAPLVVRPVHHARSSEGAVDLQLESLGTTFFVLIDLGAPPEDGPLGVAVATAREAGVVIELGPVVVREGERRADHARRLVSGAADALRGAGVSRVVAQAAPDDIDRVALLESAGLRRVDSAGEPDRRWPVVFDQEL
jgi:hypothetical protein